MTEGGRFHKHRRVRLDTGTFLGGEISYWLRRPLMHRTELEKVEASPIPHGPCGEHPECWTVSTLGLLHWLTGLTLVVEEIKHEKREDGP